MKSVYRLQFASNLNVQKLSVIQGRQLLKPVAPNIALLGDIGVPSCRKTSEFLSWCSSQYEKVYWVPGFLEMSDPEGKHTWNERIDSCSELVKPLENVHVCLKYDSIIENPHFQLLLSPLWHSTDKPIYTYTRQGPKRMTFHDFDILANNDMDWLLHTSASHSLPIAWMTYSPPGMLNYPKLLCSLTGTSDFIKNTGHFKGQPRWSSTNMGGYSGYLNDVFWEYSVTKKEISIEDMIMASLLKPSG